MGEVGIIKSSNEKFFLGQRMLQLKAKTDVILPYFLYYSLLTPEVQNQIKMHEGTGSVVSNIRIPALKKFKLMVPVLKIQESVSTMLRLIDDKIDLNNAINKNLEEMAQALFKRWFVDFEFPNENSEPYKSSGGEFEESELGLIPKGWKVKTLGEVSIQGIVCGKTPSTKEKDNFGEETPFITIPDMHNKVFVTKTERALSSKGAGTQASKTVPAFSVCVSCIATPGLVVLTSEPSQTNQQINTIICNSNECYYVYLSLSRISEYIKNMGSGGSVALNLSKSRFSNIKMVLPEQSILDQFHNLVEPMFATILLIQKETESLSITRDTLLPKLMSGEIRVPLDEEYPYSQSSDLPLAAESKAQYSTT